MPSLLGGHVAEGLPGAARAVLLADLDVVYLWADGLYVKAGLEDSKAALLVVIGALTDGRKVISASRGEHRESTEAWAGVLRGLHARGLRAPAHGGRRASGAVGGAAGVYPKEAGSSGVGITGS